MKRSVLGSFVRGVRGMLTAQLFVSVLVIALAAWTLTVTNGLIRERDRLRERVVQLEASMAERGIVVPPAPAVVESTARGQALYPGAVSAALRAPTEADAPIAIEASTAPASAESEDGINFRRVLVDLFAPAPPLRLVILHVRDAADAAQAQHIGEQLRAASKVHVVVDVLGPGDPSQSGYVYFDGRQNRATADLVAQFHDLARTSGIAVWSAQLRGAALPSQGEYAPDRLDIVLPPLPPPPPEPVATPPVAATVSAPPR